MELVISLVIETEHREDLVVLLRFICTPHNDGLRLLGLDLHIGGGRHKALSGKLERRRLVQKSLGEHERLRGEHGKRYYSCLQF